MAAFTSITATMPSRSIATASRRQSADDFADGAAAAQACVISIGGYDSESRRAAPGASIAAPAGMTRARLENAIREFMEYSSSITSQQRTGA